MLSFFYPLFLLFLANLSGHHAYCLQTADVFQVVASLPSKQEPKNVSASRRLPCLLGHFRVYGAFSNSHRPNPSPHPTNNVGRVYREFFSEFQLCIRWGERELQENLGENLRGNREMIEKYEYCSTVLRSFVQYCRYLGYFTIQVFLLSLSLTGQHELQRPLGRAHL